MIKWISYESLALYVDSNSKLKFFQWILLNIDPLQLGCHWIEHMISIQMEMESEWWQPRATMATPSNMTKTCKEKLKIEHRNVDRALSFVMNRMSSLPIWKYIHVQTSIYTKWLQRLDRYTKWSKVFLAANQTHFLKYVQKKVKKSLLIMLIYG